MATRYGDIYRLREAARKGWKYLVSDEIVYGHQPIQSELNPIRRSPLHLSEYLDRRVWWEMWASHHRGDPRGEHSVEGGVLIIEAHPRAKHRFNVAKPVKDINMSRCSEPMFVGVSQVSQERQQGHLRPIRSVIWLKAFHEPLPAILDVAEITPSGRAPKFGSRIADGELSVDWERVAFDRERPGDVVERSAEASRNLSNHRSPSPWEWLRQFGSEVVNTLVLVVGDGQWVRREEAVDGAIQSGQVLMRPLNLDPGATQFLRLIGHDTPPASQSGTGSNAR